MEEARPIGPPVALTIAGSDSGGGAGIQADLKTFAALGVFGTTAITAVTAQNTASVLGIHPLDPSFVDLQIDAVLQDLEVIAVKTGMLATPEIVASVSRRAARGELPNLVVDPVLVTSTGHRILAEGGIEAYRSLLLPHALVVTPNLPEAAALAGIPIDEICDLDSMATVAKSIHALGPRWVVVKGGHLRHGGSPDVVYDGENLRVLDGERIKTSNIHGTGCTLSAAIAAGMALGDPPLTAIDHSKEFVDRALRNAMNWTIGSGNGPLNQMGW